ncbi:MAG: Phosphoenolpyruvate synthase [Candidatus Gottesmanbacteria bacterium GW2011_GWA2_44_17]|uniref:Phosphoenolpyruvate synthase n=3 Tax=Candidatus Gottesmaniibacteriota TaxID=1752720 RepID=A0A0G1LM84_9BACT|nr:MAG: Phosphoenolpyruvate synthase [Microgenomates group bacterium GW2011_GWC1_43_11]KKT38484.1 MAG: Phosphoenolpyruvate synthase [Candidatus Gottesmanbacteria bacterium GW2011_GWB1_44_11c]KKT47798.1 MAG: Phosphoenolpyruvate synthase [Candidatus Gottesmanbacteria bacterium GW2011_GWA2_44_17]KKT60979.1 MAG: Phosphoenolpyruvate synthase [Candidatus Gottesmanbacteria bacterium GW2011_GWA1_44_24b]
MRDREIFRILYSMKKPFVVWFKDVDKEDVPLVGGKGANLGEMTKAGFPVPPGFIITSAAYFHFLDVTGIKSDIDALLSKCSVNNQNQLQETSDKIRHLLMRQTIPEEISDEVIRAYFHMDHTVMKHAIVAVRSSATAEDLPDASFAGQQETYLNVYGEAELVQKVRACWASLFTPRAIFYRATNKYDHFKVGIAVPVQKMIQSEKSGILFSLDPVTNDKEKVTIEAIFGLGEMIVQGKVTPDHYEVDKKNLEITNKVVRIQEKMMVKKHLENRIVSLNQKEGGKIKLTDPEIKKLSQLGIQLEKHYFFPQDAEWAIENNRVYIVQTRPVTTTGKKADTKQSAHLLAELLIKGDPASPGVAAGPVKILKSAKEIQKIMPGDVLVTEQTNPDYVPAMKKAGAIVTERGGRTSHAAIVSRELGIPAVVGAPKALTILKDRDVITVNGATGEIFKGSIASKLSSTHPNEEKKILKTATRVYVNLAEPERAETIAKLAVDGVGLLRAEFMIAGIGVHPKKFIKDKRQTVFINELAQKLETFCRAFDGRPVIYRATDFKTNEYRNLKGGREFEPEEPNPMLGFRGAARYIADPEVFTMELEAIKKVRNKMNLKNLHIMIPFVRTPKELQGVKDIISKNGLLRSSTFQLYLMVEIPSNVIHLDAFIDVGIDGISIGSNDLTMLLLGTDRDNSEVAHDFSEMDPTVLWAIEKAVKTAVSRRVKASICGQAPSDYPELVDKLVSWGITSISVNPDAIYRVRQTIHEAEKKRIKMK